MGEDRWAGLPDVRVTRKGFTACDRVQQRGARLGGLVQGGTRARSGVACLARHFAVQVAGRCTGTPARGRMEEGQAGCGPEYGAVGPVRPCRPKREERGCWAVGALG